MRSFCQDRLGTNIGKTQKRVAFFAGFARGQRCQDNPAPGQPGYSQPDHSFTAAAAARPAAGGGGDGDESQYLSLVLAVLGGVALTGLGAFAVVKMGFVSVVPTGASQSLLSDDAQSAQQQQQAAQQGGESSMYDEDVDMGLD
jgi:hypothetical protein